MRTEVRLLQRTADVAERGHRAAYEPDDGGPEYVITSVPHLEWRAWFGAIRWAFHSLDADTAVMSREVGQAGDWCVASGGGGGAVVIVEVQPPGQGCVALRGGRVELGIGPAVAHRAVEAFELAVGLGPVGSGSLVLDAQVSACISPSPGAVARAIVGENPLDHDASFSEPLRGPAQDPDRCRGLLVSTDLRIGDPGVVIDHRVDVGGADPGTVVLPALARAVRCRSGVQAALLATDEPVPATIGDIAELGDVDVDHRPRIGMLVTPQRLPGDAVDV